MTRATPRHDGRVTIGKKERLLCRTKARVTPAKPEQGRKRQTGRADRRAVEDGLMQSKRVKKMLYVGLDVHNIEGAGRLEVDCRQAAQRGETSGASESTIPSRLRLPNPNGTAKCARTAPSAMICTCSSD